MMAHDENGAAADDVIDAASAQGVKKTHVSFRKALRGFRA
jgi:hypothetical protein